MVESCAQKAPENHYPVSPRHVKGASKWRGDGGNDVP